MKTLMFVLIIAQVFLISCASTSANIKSALAPAAYVNEVMCDDNNCKDYWDRAQLWLANHSKMKIQTATDVLIETYNPSDQDTDYGFSVTKEPVGNRKYRITLGMYCGNMFGCSPKPEDVSRAFYHYVKYGEDLLAGKIGWGDGIR